MKTNNITQMTAADHNFEGFAVRMSRRNHHFRIYVSAAPKVVGSGKLTTRRRRAFENAKLTRTALIEIVDNPRSWRGDALTKTATKKLLDLGFNVEAPAFA